MIKQAGARSISFSGNLDLIDLKALRVFLAYANDYKQKNNQTAILFLKLQPNIRVQENA